MSAGLPLLLESDPIRLARLHSGLRRAGIDTTAVTRVADVERWPSGVCVITDADRFTPWWLAVGATGVIVLAASPEQGVAACQRGATTWLPRDCAIATLVAAVHAMPITQHARQVAPGRPAGGASDTRRVRIIKAVAGVIDGVSLSALMPGLIYNLEAGLASYLVSCGAAEESDSRPASVVPPDDPYIAHVVGGVIVTMAIPPSTEMAADKPPKVRRLRKPKSKRR